MKSYAFQDLPLKRIKKYAARFSDEEVRASLGEVEDHRPFLFEELDGTASIMYWTACNGPMNVLDEDCVRAYAQIEYLRRHGYPVFRSLEEVYAYAECNSWPRKGRNAQGPSA